MKIKCIINFSNGFIRCYAGKEYEILGFHKIFTQNGKYTAFEVEGEGGHTGPVWFENTLIYFDMTQSQIDKLLIFSS